MSDDSITLWLKQIKAGEGQAVQLIWDRYIEKLLAIARQRFGEAPRRVADEQDVMQSVFLSLYRGRPKRGVSATRRSKRSVADTVTTHTRQSCKTNSLQY